jgi:hypothetical protein
MRLFKFEVTNQKRAPLPLPHAKASYPITRCTAGEQSPGKTIRAPGNLSKRLLKWPIFNNFPMETREKTPKAWKFRSKRSSTLQKDEIHCTAFTVSVYKGSLIVSLL